MGLSPVARVGICVFFGLFLAISGLIIFIIFPKILRIQIQERLVLSPTAETYKLWKDTPVPIYMSFYLFNVTNPTQVIEKKAKPALMEMGPYVFRETRHKVNITWHDNATVSYTNLKRWYFVPEKTEGSLDDEIVTINVPAVAIIKQRLEEKDDYIANAMGEIVKQTKATLFVRQKVRELLFEGYPDTILSIAKEMKPDLVPYVRFGYFLGKNGSTDGTYSIFTGEDSMDHYGYMDRYNGKTETNSFRPPCNHVRGTAGDLFPPFPSSKPEKFELFLPEICRSVNLTFGSSLDYSEIPAERYYMDNTVFDNSLQENSCFCEEKCLPSGALDIAKCQRDSPIVVSLPHFLWADSSYRQGVTGLFPDPEAHSFFMDLQPEMGIPIRVAARMQLNVEVKPVSDIEIFSPFHETLYLPIFWFSQTATVNEETAQKLRLVTKELPQYVALGCFLLVVLGGMLLLYALYQAIRRTRSKQWQNVPTYEGGAKAKKKKKSSKGGSMQFYKGKKNAIPSLDVELQENSLLAPRS